MRRSKTDAIKKTSFLDSRAFAGRSVLRCTFLGNELKEYPSRLHLTGWFIHLQSLW
jgi:hypothetical protein